MSSEGLLKLEKQNEILLNSERTLTAERDNLSEQLTTLRQQIESATNHKRGCC